MIEGSLTVIYEIGGEDMDSLCIGVIIDNSIDIKNTIVGKEAKKLYEKLIGSEEK